MTRMQDQASAEAANARIGDMFEAHHRRLYVLARRLTASPAEAEDVVQDTFLRVARTASVPPSSHRDAEAWLVRILVNVCRDRWRTGATRRRLETVYDTPTWTQAPGNAEAALIARSTVWDALNTLAPRRRAVIVLHELDGHGVPEIARVLGVTQVTVRWHLARGLRELAQIVTRGTEEI